MSGSLLVSFAVAVGVASTLAVGAVRLTSLGASLFVGLNYEDDKFHSELTEIAESSSSQYGVDRSFPMHHSADVLVANPFYNKYINGCRKKYGHLCDSTEEERIGMNLLQPMGMLNYTETGFAKVAAPVELMEMLDKFWTTNLSPLPDVTSLPFESWASGNTYTNHWYSPTTMLHLGDELLRNKVWDATKAELENWVGVELSPSSLYGIRVYHEGAVLAPHVDRIPLVISAIINVAQDVEEPWPLEVIGHDGKAHNITIFPGEMILYESASVIHGRPFPLKGKRSFYANVFVHFEPLGISKNELSQEPNLHLAYLYQKAWKRQQAECDNDDCKLQIDFNLEEVVPPYILPGSEEEKRWIQNHPRATTTNAEEKKKKTNEYLSKLDVHFAAASGDLNLLKLIAAEDPKSLHRVDRNGWTALHEAARGGHPEVIDYLLQNGLDINQRTHKGNGGSPLWWAKKFRGTHHKIVAHMQERGAVEVPPEGHQKIE